ncbi:MAG: oligosaccharide flippase family protein [Okeania sp. SIO3I5]|uniref:oligosaccharide flippase family protein n=1 Tax=Okeania sp. SIO3I5 TaxID=2607805 RepID=UPI0013BB9E55|nr:oligosaccharide flippase family protein [Okeania sp. SIO3I5]NEQ41910.1 oligosaccharide flippase family protein [Okeania sp. SIO3I5]
MTQTSLSGNSDSFNFSALVKDVKVVLILKLTGLLLVYLVKVFLARWMGKTEYGIYEYVISWSLLLAIPAGLGFPSTVLRLISEYRVKQDWARLGGIIRGSLLLTILASIFLCLVSTALILLLDHYYSFAYTKPLLIGIWLVPLQALVQLFLETARGMKDFTLAYAPSLVISPILLLSGGLFFLQRNHALRSITTIEMAMVMLAIALSFQLWLLWGKLNREVEQTTPIYNYQEWIRIALVLLLQAGFTEILNQTDIVMVGSVIGAEDAGIYSAAVKTAQWVAFALQTVNIVVAPAFTTLYLQGDRQELQKLVFKVTVWIFWFSLAVGTILIIFAQPVMGLFGSDFVAAHWQLKILVLGRVVDSLCGSVGTLLIMTGYQNKMVFITGYAALINIILNAVLIPIFGSIGAAIATSLTIAMWNVWVGLVVIKNLGIYPSVFYGFLGRKGNRALDSSPGNNSSN